MLYSSHANLIVTTTAWLLSFHSILEMMTNRVRILCFGNVVFGTHPYKKAAGDNSQYAKYVEQSHVLLMLHSKHIFKVPNFAAILLSL